MTLILLKSTGQLFDRISLNLAVFMIRSRLHILGKNSTEVMLFSEGYRMSICLITGEVNLGHVDEVVSANFFYCKVKIFCFVINKYPSVRT